MNRKGGEEGTCTIKQNADKKGADKHKKKRKIILTEREEDLLIKTMS